MTQDLFASEDLPCNETLGPGAMLLRGFGLQHETELLAAVNHVTTQAPFRRMVTRQGFHMSVAMTNCGELGWVTDRSGYRYDPVDPQSCEPWPALPKVISDLATRAASEAGFREFRPDACLINRYDPGAKMSLHQDKDEHDFDQPIVSVSLGIPATFLFGGFERAAPATRVLLLHGDVAVWGGPARLRYHGVLPLKPAHHPRVGGHRINLTLRKAG
jgi:alkylated DNA repair protein (DNA oxidative demethylase)